MSSMLYPARRRDDAHVCPVPSIRPGRPQNSLSIYGCTSANCRYYYEDNRLMGHDLKTAQGVYIKKEQHQTQSTLQPSIQSKIN